MTFKVVENVVLGKRTATRALGALQQALEELPEGAGIFFDEDEYKDSTVQAASNAANARAKRLDNGKQFSSRKVEGGRWIVRVKAED